MHVFLLLLGVMLSTASWALTSAEYLPSEADLDPGIPAPESALGWEIGEWRITHDQLARYMEILAASSDRVSITEIGRTHERRPLLHLVITSAENHGQLEVLRQLHLEAANGKSSEDAPLVLWMGHSIHGTESSGSNASTLLAYYLAASRSDFVTGLLEDSIIVLDPSFNPDGLQRFSTWSNSNRSLNPVGDPSHRIHNEAWPESRTNHYLFDLNRDWLPLVHPESRARVAAYHHWLPHVLTDQHETMRYDNYFFQPGVPSRTNPAIPGRNQELTAALAQFHAAAMDGAGELYFTKDGYDDFYFGKGSTYPDINGSIGILFEQPRFNGPLKETDNGPRTFTTAVANQLRTSLSTLRGADQLRNELAAYQAGFFDTMRERAGNAGFRAWVIGDDGDPARARALLDVLDLHRVEHQPLAVEIRAGGHVFRPGHAWVLDVRQRQFGSLQAIMESLTEFEDETFYDVSAWTLPLAYNLPYTRLSRLPETGPAPAVQTSSPDPKAVAWLIPWGQLEAPAILQQLLASGARVRAATRPFSADTGRGRMAFRAGTLLIHRGSQDKADIGKIFGQLSIAADSGLVIDSTHTALTAEGPDLGTSHFRNLDPIAPLLISGDGTSISDVGEIWHQMDQRLGKSPVMVEMLRLDGIRLHDYSHMIMADGDYSAINRRQRNRIVNWVRDGGILISSAGASKWAEHLCFDYAANNCAGHEHEVSAATPDSRPYATFSDDDARQRIGGAIVSASADLTHPLAFGLSRSSMPLFRRGTTVLKPGSSAYATPVRYSPNPLMAGFIGAEQQDRIRGEPAVIAERKGNGLVVRFANNPLFRGYWRGTERLFNNALYMGQIVENTEISN